MSFTAGEAHVFVVTTTGKEPFPNDFKFCKRATPSPSSFGKALS